MRTMSGARDFTRGPIARQVAGLALPIVGAAFLNMAYNISDLFWIGRVGSLETAAVGGGGIFLWLGASLALMPRVGAEVSISQSHGAGQSALAQRYARQALVLASVLGLTYGVCVFSFRHSLIGLFSLNEPRTYQLAVSYLGIVAWSMPFAFVIMTFSGLYNGYGRARMPFVSSGLGLTLNIILDPLMIHGYLGFPALGVEGAGYATVISQAVALLVFILINQHRAGVFHGLMDGYRPSWQLTWRIVRLGAPVALQNALFALITLVIARLVARWGDLGVAVLTVGAQVEAISWMTASGFATALSSFVGQNWGARQLGRIRRGYGVTLGMTLTLGGVATLLFMHWGEAIFGVIAPREGVREAGGVYLRILGISQVFMVLEIVSAGVFNGIGRTGVPSIVGIGFNLLRIPLSLWLGGYALSGIWWSITLSSVLKGTVLALWLLLGSAVFGLHLRVRNAD